MSGHSTDKCLQIEPRLTTGQCATLACLLEVTAPKPGNVHRGADFDDVTFDDFVISAVAIGPIMDRAASQPVGQTILQAIDATRQFVATNTNLGMVLLFAPLAAVPRHLPIQPGLQKVLSNLVAEDSMDVYAAIRMARPGGLSRVDNLDIAGTAPTNLLDAMRLAADWDLIARQYATGFETVFNCVVPWLVEGQAAGWSLAQLTVYAYLRLLALEPDSLIARKCGRETAIQASQLAMVTLEAGTPGDEAYHTALSDLDFWLRCDGHRRNPGTTADLIAAGLFTVLRDGQLKI
jgi:triphosphoribosyl-dephospho-CoA synthase